METSPLLAPSPCLVSPHQGVICLVFFPLLGGGLLSGLYGFGCYMELPPSKSSLQPGLGWQQSGSTKRLHHGTSSKGATRRGCCLLQRGIANPSRVQTSSKREKKFFFLPANLSWLTEDACCISTPLFAGHTDPAGERSLRVAATSTLVAAAPKSLEGSQHPWSQHPWVPAPHMKPLVEAHQSRHLVASPASPLENVLPTPASKLQSQRCAMSDLSVS